MAPLRWIARSGLRVTMTIALAVFLYQVVNELRVLRGGAMNFHQRLELTALTIKLAARGKRPPLEWKVAVAGADEKSIKEFGRLPWSRSVHAALTRRLTALGAKAIAFDMTFDEPSSSESIEVMEGIRSKAESAGLGQLPEELRKSASSIQTALAARARPPISRRNVIALERSATTALATADRLEKFERDLLAPTAPHPDLEFADAIRESGRVVLGYLNLSKREALSLGVTDATTRAALALVSSSTISEMVSKGEDGLSYVHGGAASSFESGLYRRYFGLQPPTEVLARATKHFGTLNAFPDDDGVYRRMPLVSSIQRTGVLVPTLALKAVEVALAPMPIEIVANPDDAAPEAIEIGGSHRIETELEAATTLDWYGLFNADEMPIHSIADILSGAVSRAEIEGRIVFVAATAVGTHDQRVTPLEPAVPGIYIHATLAQNILDGRRLTRPLHVLAIELGLFLLIGVLAGLVMTRLDVLGEMLVGIAMAAGWVAFDQFVLFASGLIVVTVLPAAQIFLTLLAVALWRFLIEQKERRKTKQAFGRYLAPKVMEQVLNHPEIYLKLGGQRYDATVLFSDIRGFTTISEALVPEELGTLLNRYMTPMTDIVFRHDGTLDKYIGDAVMALWGAPLEQPNHPVLACRAALEMIEKVKALNVDFEAEGLPHIAIGIGIASGPMTIGNLGSDDHFSYTAIGDRVNLGARLEGQTKDYGVDIILADSTYRCVQSEMLCRELGSLRVKGKYEPVRIYQLIGDLTATVAKQSFVDTFHAGLESYRNQRWNEAIEHFTRARALAGVNGDKCSDDYIAWCMEYQEAPPPRGWDGVRVATSK